MDSHDHLTPYSRALVLPFVYSAGWLPSRGSGPSEAPIYFLGKELTIHYQSSFVALSRILHELLQGWCTPELCYIIFLVADHRTTSATLSRIWCLGRTLRESQAVPAILSHPKREPPQQNVACLLRRYARRPISWWRQFPEGGRIPIACCLPLARSSLRDFFWSLLKLCCQHHGLEGISCLLSELWYFSVLRVDITFHSQWMRSSRNPPTLSDPFHWFSLSLQEALLVYVGRE